jgi:hypothetical protein
MPIRVLDFFPRCDWVPHLSRKSDGSGCGVVFWYGGQERIISPAFITEHPELMSPLAKYHRTKPGITERCVAGLWERRAIADADSAARGLHLASVGLSFVCRAQ